MLDFSPWKKRWVLTTVVVGVLMSLPSLLPDSVTRHLPGWATRSISLGLDLAGGSYLLLEAQTSDVAATRLEAMRETVRSEMRRGPQIDIGDISVQNGRLTFRVNDPSKVDAARERVNPFTSGAGMTGQRDWNIEVLNGQDVVLTPTGAGIEQAIDQAMDDATDVVRRRIDELGTREPSIMRQGANRIVVQVPGLQNPQALKELLGRTARLEFKLVDETVSPQQLAQGIAPVGSQILPMQDGGGNIAVKRSVIISGDQLADARMEYDQQTGQPQVSIQFNGAGGRRFAKVTAENVNKPFAIIVDDKVISAPNIQEPILGGQARISGTYTAESANALAIALRSGKLPVALAVVDERTVGPDLGADSIRKGSIAAAVGTALVIVLMIATYLRFGVYATIALLVNILMLLGIMGRMGATLTLPGIAGFVLTIGAAVDANVLINERIREEQRRGRSVIQSIEFGYKEASRAIFDANITNVIAAAIMFFIGSGPVRGFAVVLMVGIFTSVFTGVLFTRLMVSEWLKKRPKELVI